MGCCAPSVSSTVMHAHGRARSRGAAVEGKEVGAHLSGRMHVNPAAMLMTEANEITMWLGCVSDEKGYQWRLTHKRAATVSVR